MDYERMKKIYDYVYSTKPKSPERAARLAELSEDDRTALFDFDMGLMSGRVKKTENKTKKSEVSTVNKIKKIESYEDFKKAVSNSSYYTVLKDFHQNSPDLYSHYSEKFEKEKKR